MTLILGLIGLAGSGKSTAAAHLVERYGAVRYALVDPLKELAMRVLDFTREQCYGTQAEKEAVDPRYGFSPRWFLQRLGTEGCRVQFGANFWTEQLMRRIEKDAPALAVVDDVRFPDEAVILRRGVRNGFSRGGLVWRLECPDRATDAGEHESERSYLNAPCDRVITAALSPGSATLRAEIDAAVAAEPKMALIREPRIVPRRD